MMKIVSCFFSFLFIVGCLSAEIIQVDQFKGVEERVVDLDENALVLFDVDYTVLIPEDAILRPCGQKLVKKYVSEILDTLPPEKYPDGYLLSQVLLHAKSSLVNPKLKELIQHLQDTHIRVIAFTGAVTGKMGAIDSMEDHRIEELRAFGLDFTQAFPNYSFLKFPKKSDKEFPPLFKSGVLFASKHPKGEVLKQFLDATNTAPKKVVFIDDRMEYLQSVDTILKCMGIAFLGLHYVEAEKNSGSVDEKVAEFQFRYLAEHGRWLSDEEARNLQ